MPLATGLQRAYRCLVLGSLALALQTAQASEAAIDGAPAWTDEPPVLARLIEDGYRAETRGMVQLAATRYCAAARHGSVEGQFLLGRLLLQNRKMNAERQRAPALLAMASRQGHARAERLLLEAVRPDVPFGDAPPDCMLSDEAPVLADNGEAVPPEVLARFVRALSAERRSHAQMIQRLAPKFGIDPGLALAIARTESNFDASARSPKNAQGLMQLIPETAARFGVRDILDPEQNIRGGLAYLRWLLNRFEGDVALAAAAYNAGEGAVDRHGGIPPYAETRAYVERILAFYRASHHPMRQKSADASPHFQAARGV